MKESLSKKTFELIEQLPKILLHTHLEGSVPRSTLAMLSRRNGIQLTFPAKSQSIVDSGRPVEWRTFLNAFLTISSCFRNRHDFHDAVVGYAANLAKENIIYAEFHCSPWNHLSRGVALDEIGQGLFSGIEAARKEHRIGLKVICDLVRNPNEDILSILTWIRDLPRTHFIAIGISGGPDSIPLENYEPYCDKARDASLRVVAHAGELEGPISVRIAVEHLRVDRICHGVRVLEDMGLLDEVISRGIHFELCPTSNYALGVGQPQYLSIRNLLNSGVNCSINTDDELLFNTCLSKELFVLEKNGTIDFLDILSLQKNAASAAFIDALEKASIIDEFTIAWQTLCKNKWL